MPKQPCPKGQTWSEKLQKCVEVKMMPSKIEVPGSLDTTKRGSGYERLLSEYERLLKKDGNQMLPTPKKKTGGAKTKASGSMMKKGGTAKRKK